MTSHTLPRISTHVCSGHWAGLALNKKCSDEDCGHSSWLLSCVWWPGLLFLDWWELHDTADRIFKKSWEERRIIGTLVKKKLNIPETELSWAVMMMITMAREKPLNLSLSLMVDNYYWIRPPSDISQHLETTDQQTFLYIICLWCNHINECVLWFSLHLCLSQTKGRCQKSFFLIDLKIHKSIPYFLQKR